MSEQITLTPEAQLSLNESATQNDWDQKRVETANDALLSIPDLTQVGREEEAFANKGNELADAERTEGLNALAAAAIGEAAARNDWSQDKVEQVTAEALANQNK